jgi:hypothetical protein
MNVHHSKHSSLARTVLMPRLATSLRTMFATYSSSQASLWPSCVLAPSRVEPHASAILSIPPARQEQVMLQIL